MVCDQSGIDLILHSTYYYSRTLTGQKFQLPTLDTFRFNQVRTSHYDFIHRAPGSHLSID